MATTEQELESDNGNNNLLTTRAREWQDAFQSLYSVWLERIHQLDAKLQEQQQDISDHHDDVLKDITETYFYACGKGHTLLFRVGVVQPLDNDSSNPVGDDAGKAQQQIHTVPEIILSSSTLSLREKLRSLGASVC
jgi:hypothetical protein